MAKYIGTLTSDIRGKVGGLCFSRSRNGTTIGARAVQKIAPSPAQSNQRMIMAAALTAWRQLSDADQVSWGQVAFYLVWKNSLGQTYAPTGLQLWQQAYSNANRFNRFPPSVCGGTPGSIPAVLSSLLNIDDFYIAGSAGTYPYPWLVFMTFKLSPSRNYINSLARKFITYGDNVPYVSVSAQYYAAFGVPLIAGDTIGVRVVPCDPTYWYSGTTYMQRLTVL